MASQIVSEKSVPIHSNSTTGKGHKKNATSNYLPNTRCLIRVPYSENWCVQHQFSLNKFSLNKFSLDKFSPNNFKKRIGSP